MVDDNRAKALAAALSQIEKQFGKGSIMRMDAEAIKDIEVVSTGSLGLDLALGVGGLPRGRVVEIYGPESSGKTTLTLQVIAEVQKTGGQAAFIDAENALDVGYAAKLGVKTEELPDLPARYRRTGARDRRHAGPLRRGRCDRHRFGRGPDAEGGNRGRDGRAADGLAGAADEPGVAQADGQHQAHQHARDLHQPDPHEDRRHVRQSGNDDRRNALKFYASVRMDIRRIGSIKKGDEVIGSETRVKIVKNKVAPPFRSAEFDILYGSGISRDGEILELGVAQGVLEKSGAWYIYKEDRLGQGKDNAREFLGENQALAREIEAKIREKAGLVGAAPAAPASEEIDDGKVEKLPTRKRN
jgi:recombination protein RecA